MITVIGNLKGGTGKSTLAFNLAVWLVYQKKRIQLYDLDPQQTLADAVAVRQEEAYSPALPSTQDATNFADTQSMATDSVDHILMDVSMSNSDSLKKAIRLSDRIIIPVAPSQADIWSTQRFLKMIREERPAPPELIGVVNRADTHPFVIETRETEEAMDALPDMKRIDRRLHNRTAYRRSFSEGLGVFEMEPNGKASHEFNKVAQLLFS
ncbi:MAG: AAA family ATPase [Hydrogenovibrio sp.]